VNLLQELTIHVNQGNYDHETYFPAWVNLFNMVTDINRFPHLRKLTMKVFSYEGLYEDRIKEWRNLFILPERPQLGIEIKLLDECKLPNYQFLYNLIT